jgi:hypothetical protein
VADGSASYRSSRKPSTWVVIRISHSTRHPLRLAVY